MGVYYTLVCDKAKEFVAGLVWGTNCGEKRDAYFEVQDAETGSVRLEKRQIEGSEAFQQGCGNRYYMNQWPKVDGKYTDRLTCECGASLRPFPALERFRARTK